MEAGSGRGGPTYAQAFGAFIARTLHNHGVLSHVRSLKHLIGRKPGEHYGTVAILRLTY
jgi:hypothetical protein